MKWLTDMRSAGVWVFVQTLSHFSNINNPIYVSLQLIRDRGSGNLGQVSFMICHLQRGRGFSLKENRTWPSCGTGMALPWWPGDFLYNFSSPRPGLCATVLRTAEPLPTELSSLTRDTRTFEGNSWNLMADDSTFEFPFTVGMPSVVALTKGTSLKVKVDVRGRGWGSLGWRTPNRLLTEQEDEEA
jgi:hypothetical protein